MIGFLERDAAHNRDLLRCFFSRRCMRSWRSRGWALLRPEAAHLPPPSSLHLMCSESITWRNCPCLLSKACKLTAALAAKAYSAAGQAASAMHAMAILQVHQAKALKQMHEGSTTTSAQVTLLNPEMGMVPRYSSRYNHANAFPLIQPLHGPCLSTGQSALRTIASSCRLLQWMPLMWAGALHTTGMQPRGSGQGLNCFGTSTASSCWQCY